mgnify:CR=1 FL=1|jgi:hypothetical protein
MYEASACVDISTRTHTRARMLIYTYTCARTRTLQFAYMCMCIAYLLHDLDLFTACCTQDGCTSLMLAISYGHINTANLLVSAGADVNAKDEVSFT